MTEIAYLVLAHKDPAGLIERVRMLTAQGDRVVIHFDRNARAADYRRLTEALATDASVAFAPRIRCGWGEWSLVAASLGMVRTALARFPAASHLYMISGDCTPIKPRAHIAQLLGAVDRDFIEHHDFFESDWIKTGLKEERLIYRHLVNERRRKRLFYALMEIQRRLGLSRSLPEGLQIRIGSQWWVLRRATAERVLAHVDANPSLIRFFRTTWIPDETFFQTIVAHVTPRQEIENRTLTFLAFSDYGMPVVLHDDHAGMLGREDHLFARKVSAEATGLRARMAEIYAAPAETAGGGGDARRLYAYYTWLGRQGQRGAPRIWEAGRDIGEGRQLHLLLAKKWHLGKRFVDLARDAMPSFGYVFDEDLADLPALGGLSFPREKRSRHRRAFLNLLFSSVGTDRLLICLDPGQTGIVEDLARDPCLLRVLEIATDLDDEFLAGHAGRLGLIPPDAPPDLVREVVEALRRQIEQERRAIDRMALPSLQRISARTRPDRLFARLAAFLDVTEAEAQGMVAPDALFD